MKVFRRIISVLLSLVLIAEILPQYARAEEIIEEIPAEIVEEIPETEIVEQIVEEVFHETYSEDNGIMDTAAEDLCGEDLFWAFDETNGTLTISGTGEMWDYAIDEESGIPGYPWAEHTQDITSVILEGTVTSIGDHAFENCIALNEITGLDHVIRIGASAFQNCTNLTQITLFDTLTSICGDAFCYSGLEEVILPGSVADMGSGIFQGAYHLKSVTLEEGITKIPSHTFVNCFSLSEVTLPETLESIELWAFFTCVALESIEIPASVTRIHDYAFHMCPALTGIWVAEENPYYSSDSFGILFNKDKTKLITAPGGLSGDYLIPKTVTELGNYAFANCALSSITIPGSVYSVGIPRSAMETGPDVFGGCENLTSVTILEGACEISVYAFRGCSRLAWITIPDTVEYIGEGAFADCEELTDVHFSGSEADWLRVEIGADNACLTDAVIH